MFGDELTILAAVDFVGGTYAVSPALGPHRDPLSDREEKVMPLVSYETEQQIELTLHRYCEAIDTADFNAFAAIFEHGQWFMVQEPGSRPVREWLDSHIVLYNGHTYTRHEISNLSIQPGDTPDKTTFNCYLSIWQDLPEEPPKLMAHARFDGSFRHFEEAWWWSTHQLTVHYFGDLSGHIRDADG